jgi:hypothetical protein
VAGNQGETGSVEIDKTVDPGPGPAPVATTAPVVLGIPRVGSLLTGVDGDWDQDGLTFTRQWLRDGAPIKNATDHTYRLTGKDAGHKISVQVTATKDGVAPGTAVSAATVKVVKAGSRTNGSVSDTTVRSGAKVDLQAAVSALGVVPSGKVDVYYRGERIRTLTLLDGKVSSSLRPIVKGKHTLQFSYRGSDGVLSSSDTVTIRVR